MWTFMWWVLILYAACIAMLALFAVQAAVASRFRRSAPQPAERTAEPAPRENDRLAPR